MANRNLSDQRLPAQKSIKRRITMKSSVKIVLSALMLTSLVVIGSQAYAQNELKVNVPFNYIANGRQYPAGTYSIGLAHTSVVRITDASQSKVMLVNPAEASEPATTSKLVFHCYGNSCFLSEIWVAGRTRGVELNQSKAERQLQLEAKRTADREVVMASK
jgi:hypothetical protein